MHPERLSNDTYMGLASPFRMFRHTLTSDIALHWHEFYELAFVISGEGAHVLNGSAARLAPGTVFLLTPTDFHALCPEGTLELYNFIFSDALLSDDLRTLVFGNCKQYHVNFESPQRASIHECFRTIWAEEQGRASGFTLMIRASFEQILVSLSRQQAASLDYKPVHHPAVQKALLYIDHHFREPLSLKQLAEHVHLAPNYLSELFQRAIDMPFQNYLQDVRLRFALTVLQSTDVSVTEVCYISGFNNLSHFTRAFKRKFGYPPRESRRQDRHVPAALNGEIDRR